MTEWRAIPGFSDYAISRSGEVKCLRASPGHSIGAPIQTPVDHRGYRRARITADNGRKRVMSVHVSVLEAFVGLRPSGHDASHLNGVRIDCRVENLAWETPSQNHRRKLEHGTLIHGEKHKCSKLKVEQVREIKSRAARGEIKANLARDYGVSDTLIYRIVAGKAWMHAA